jgi:hypothetical protein
MISAPSSTRFGTQLLDKGLKRYAALPTSMDGHTFHLAPLVLDHEGARGGLHPQRHVLADHRGGRVIDLIGNNFAPHLKDSYGHSFGEQSPFMHHSQG